MIMYYVIIVDYGCKWEGIHYCDAHDSCVKLLREVQKSRCLQYVISVMACVDGCDYKNCWSEFFDQYENLK